jgi:hypothetical protein
MGIATANPQTTLAVGSMESTAAPRIATVASSMGLAIAKLSVVSTLVRNDGHQDDVVSPQLASMALTIGMATTKTMVDDSDVDSILLMAVEAMGQDQWL